MLTRSKARALAAERSMAVGAPSVTGHGTHTRWKYPYALPSKPIPTSDSLFCGSLSSLSSDSSLSSIPSDAYFHAAAPVLPIPETPRRTIRPPVTPPRLAPKRRLQRSPGRCRWVQENGYTRVILVEDSFTPEAINMRESIMQIQLNKIADREMEALMRQRNLLRHVQEQWDSEEMECESERSPEGSYDGSSEEYSDMEDEDADADDFQGGFGAPYLRGDTVAADEAADTVAPLPGPSRQVRRLGPTGTELIDPESFTSFNAGSNAVYPDAWSRALRGQPTEEFFN
ncbi:hypothetical protein DXG03_009228 [Asterophora parasitica]|uniref:Uncharacterized protein n=1 Tax=Asterophora parasitica TaxID=117018 RepID=A0A9P7G8B2_9AGAR|nr:hypothetical protein DXG03_009228 [Asterophora parasitica]